MRHRTHRIIIFILAIVYAAVVFGSPEDTASQFSRANELYEQGKFADALDLYLEIERHIANWKIFFNIGNCYFKQGQPILAKIYYLRAQRLKPFEPSIEKNLQVVDMSFKDVVPPEKPDFIAGVFLRLRSVISLDLVSWFLLLAVAGLNVFIFLWLLRGRTKIVSYGVSFFIIIAIILSFYHMVRINGHETRDAAVVSTADSELRSGPGEQNTVLFKVNPGLKVRIIEKNKDWYQVTASAQIAGWIKKELLIVI